MAEKDWRANREMAQDCTEPKYGDKLGSNWFKTALKPKFGIKH